MDAESFDGVACAVRGNVLVSLWQAPARLARVRWLRQKSDDVSRRHPEGFMVLQLILASSTPPDSESRAEVTAMMKQWSTSLRLLVTVPLGDALWTTLVRTIMRAALIMSGTSGRHIVAGNEREGIAQVLSRASSHTPQQAALVAAINALYAGAPAAPPPGGCGAQSVENVVTHSSSP